jgi:PKD repeat protein/subtilisin family serine protease
MRRLLTTILVVGLAGAAAWGQVRIGALSEDLSFWQGVVARAQAAGIKAQVTSYSESALYQQVYFWAAFGRSSLDLVGIPREWLPQVAGRLLDLSPWLLELQAAGLEVVAHQGRPVGAAIPGQGEKLAAVIASSPRSEQAVQVLFHLVGDQVGEPAAPVPTAAVVPLRVGPLTLSKLVQDLPGVDGALEMFAQAMAQAVPQGVVTALARVPAPARDALIEVAERLGLPLTPDGTGVQVVVEGAVGVSPLAAGAREEERSPSGLSLVTVPFSQLSSFLASLAGRAKVRPPFRPEITATSQGAGLVGAPLFHAQGIRGAGVKIAVIDVGFIDYTLSQARGDLPPTLITHDLTGTGIATDYRHGTAVAEIVYDIAPQATLYLIKIANEVHLDNAVSYCISQGVDVIVHSLGWFNTNFYDGQGLIPDMVRRAEAAGILWVQAAGNSAQNHWEGYFTDTNGDGLLDQEITFRYDPADPDNSSSYATLYLTWDGWPQTADDYDIFLYGPGGGLVASSTKTQGGTEEPTELISVSLSQVGEYRIRIQLASGSPRKLELFSIYHELTPNVISSSIPAPGNAAAALTVAAIPWDRYSSGPAADYSSRGPTNDGRLKPDLAAPDNVATGVAYYDPFPGTSAAAPHVAGIAALLLSEDPGLSLSALRSRLLSHCVSMGDQYAYGAGRLEASPQAPTAQPDLVIQNITYSPSSPSVGSTVSFQVTVRNQGAAAAGTFRVRLVGAGPAAEANVGSLAAGASHTVNLSLPLSTSPETFTATADYYGQVTESDEGNNQAQVTVTGITPLPDLVIQSVTYTPSSPTVGQLLTFQITVRNQGGSAAGAFYVRLSDGGGHQNASLGGLAAGASHTVSLSLPLTAASETFTVTADAFGQVNESDEANNAYQLTVTAATPALSFSLALDRASYQVGDPVRIRVELSRGAYVYLVELDPTGRAKLIFPNFWERNPQLPAGTTWLPRASYTIQASQPTGTSQLVGFASDSPIPYFPTNFPSPDFPVLSNNGSWFLSQVRAWLAANVPAGGWAEDTVSFTVQPATNQPPTARFSYSPGSPNVGQLIQFDASASSDPDGTIVSYSWEFGDGETATGVRVNKRYGTAGTYTVRLTVQDDRGATDTETKQVTVGPPPNQSPTARFSYTPTNPDPGDVVAFDGSASSDPDGTIVAWEWDFGDGTTGSGVVVNHAFPADGTYTVTLTVRDDDGATDSVSHTVQVGAPPTPPLPGMPEIDEPGFYIWGDHIHWHITVVGDPAWSSPKAFRVALSGRGGRFRDLKVTPSSGPSPTLGSGSRSFTWEGTIGAGWVDLEFRSTMVYVLLEFYLDLDGDGTPELVPPEYVYLRQYKVNPPVNPMVFGRIQPSDIYVYISRNFRIGQGSLSAIVWLTTIEELET